MSRQLPAHGKKWVELRRQGLAPSAGIFDALILLDHWKVAAGWPHLVISEDKSPEGLDFRVLYGRAVTLAYLSTKTDFERVTASVDAILRDGAEVVATLDRDNRDASTIRRAGHGR
jgi:hypothetical protein